MFPHGCQNAVSSTAFFPIRIEQFYTEGDIKPNEQLNLSFTQAGNQSQNRKLKHQEHLKISFLQMYVKFIVQLLLFISARMRLAEDVPADSNGALLQYLSLEEQRRKHHDCIPAPAPPRSPDLQAAPQAPPEGSFPCSHVPATSKGRLARRGWPR